MSLIVSIGLCAALFVAFSSCASIPKESDHGKLKRVINWIMDCMLSLYYLKNVLKKQLNSTEHIFKKCSCLELLIAISLLGKLNPNIKAYLKLKTARFFFFI